VEIHEQTRRQLSINTGAENFVSLSVFFWALQWLISTTRARVVCILLSCLWDTD
jgi:hypothetical protein